jgi:putative tricarboxylic transport membrane protein
MQDINIKGGPDRATLVVALILFGLAAALFHEASVISGAVNYGVGPGAALKIVGGGLAFLGLCSVVSAFRNTGIARPDAMNAGPVWIILAACVAMIICINFGGGFILGTTILFAATATAFGRRAYLADIGIGLVTAILIYLMFSKLLTLTLPQGPLERLIG